MSNKDMVVAGQDNSALIVNDQLDEKKVLAQYGENAADWQFTADQPAHYYKPSENTYLMGVIESKYTGKHETFGDYTCYVLVLTQPAVGTSRDTDEDEVLEVGDKISVLERSAFKALDALMGKEVVIICDGKLPTKTGKTFWKIRVGARK
jgi:hypothetical protein